MSAFVIVHAGTYGRLQTEIQLLSTAAKAAIKILLLFEAGLLIWFLG